MTVENVVNYQSEIITFLKSAFKKDRLTHAYIFEGEHGTGTYEAALYFAMMLLCEKDEPCLKCHTCERIKYNSHMNVITIEPYNNSIRKDQIEGLMQDFHHTTLEGGANIYIIKDANLMNTAAENALLKMLEEPNPRHYIILTCKNHLSLLPTINSRCQILKFKSIASSVIEEELIKNKCEKDIAFIISKFTSDVDIALEYKKNDTFKEIYNLVKKIYISLFKTGSGFSEYFINREFIVNKDKSFHDFFIGTMILVIEEYIRNNTKSEYFKDIYTTIGKYCITEAELIRKLNILTEYQIKLNVPTNIDLFYTALFELI